MKSNVPEGGVQCGRDVQSFQSIVSLVGGESWRACLGVCSGSSCAVQCSELQLKSKSRVKVLVAGGWEPSIFGMQLTFQLEQGSCFSGSSECYIGV